MCCRQCFADINGVSKSTLARVFVSIKKGGTQPVQRDGDVVHAPTVKKEECLAWIRTIYTTYGDYMPDDLTVCLPCYNRKALYNWYRQSPIVFDHFESDAFNLQLREQFPFISFRRYKKFMQCHECNTLDKKTTLCAVHFLTDRLMSRQCTWCKVLFERSSAYCMSDQAPCLRHRIDENIAREIMAFCISEMSEIWWLFGRLFWSIRCECNFVTGRVCSSGFTPFLYSKIQFQTQTFRVYENWLHLTSSIKMDHSYIRKMIITYTIFT